ncbi:hypothetical protein, partial [Aureimonas sp. AU4]|uniref:hypothetical protein n=1 Tax=Aureimonas sp. AU4 TaxID=1638163 RepID=UPI00178CF1B3
LTHADIVRIADETVRRVQAGGAKLQAQEVYRAIERERSIKGVGVTTEKGARPRSVVGRGQFRERAGYDVGDDQTLRERSRIEEDTIVLVSPVLEMNQRHRKWRFLRRGEPFNATVEDPAFLQKVLSGRTRIPMVAGIELRAVVEITETRNGLVWEVTARRVLDVRDVRPPSEHPNLFPPEGKSDEHRDQ